MALAPTTTALPPSPVLLIDNGCRLRGLGQLCGVLIVGLRVVTHHALCRFGRVLVSASRAYPVLMVGVESVPVIVLLTGIDGGVKSRTAACIGARSLGGLSGAAGPWALTQALCTADGSGPVQVGANLAGPLISNLSHAG